MFEGGKYDVIDFYVNLPTDNVYHTHTHMYFVLKTYSGKTNPQ